MVRSGNCGGGVGLIVFALLVAVPSGVAGCGGEIGAQAGDDFLSTGRTASFFRAFQVDPRSEDSAGPQFVVAGDLNDDNRIDLISAWNQSQPVQIHLQRRTASGGVGFETVTLAGNIPTVRVAGLEVADFDQDGALDVAVLVKESLVEGAGCLDSEQPPEGLSGLIVLYLGPADVRQTNQALAWDEIAIAASQLQGAGEPTGRPEDSGFSSLEAGDVDNDGDTDLVAAWNSACGEGTRDAVVFSNHGRGAVRDGNWTGIRVPDDLPKGTTIKDVALADIDGDNDLDIVATFPDAPTMNIRWYRNPVVDTEDDYHISGIGWQPGLVGHIAAGADVLETGDLDDDGRVDVVVRSSAGGVIQWFRGPVGPTTAPLRSIPWQVYTLAEFVQRAPASLALGEVNSDGRLDLVASAGGTLAWFAGGAADSVYDPWRERLIVDDEVGSAAGGTAGPEGGVNGESPLGGTQINAILVTDIDSDGRNDVVTTLDRGGLSGITNDALAWVRNTLE